MKGVARSVGGLGAMMWNHFPKMNAMTDNKLAEAQCLTGEWEKSHPRE